MNLIKDSVFPKFCVLCNEEGAWVCRACRLNLEVKNIAACPVCKQKRDKGKTCTNCDSYLDRHLAIFDFKNQKVKTIIHKFKYEYVTEILNSLLPVILSFLEKHEHAFPESGKIVPVPLHKKRKSERGFDQAYLIAKILKKELDLPVLHSLTRVKNTKQQAELKRNERLSNVKGAFELDAEITCSEVVLVDDVFTTGATLEECAGVLKDKSEVTDITGFTLARGF